ncbi:M23 family metallopeptidase [Parvibaculum sp.]|uniref:M23 family metallopeptidase n=1 Tax=Parvibaculum sp. TaxID=2024848 RepID=UPI001D5EB2AC|nr:M23 family metallopeptidase [Parvibaculum sp.]MBX3487874.1 M23 family metallopeptidase [Parvibaculum sp.]MCW5728132.1 M23 family metallopeptidase [Parvibaculum sp.]
MKRRQPNSVARPVFSGAAFFLSSLLSLFLLLPSTAAMARGVDLATVLDPVAANHILPLDRPVAAVPSLPDRALHFGDPIDTAKARMTSGYGWRVHPVLKDKRLHRGVDWAAPKGTPVYAAEDGIVTMAGWRGNYGKLVTIKHAANVETFYAHLSGFAPGVRAGAGVKKGDVIGYVGKTGLATGNHLYYEVAIDNERVDPLADDLNAQVNVLAVRVTRPDGQIAETRGLIEAR